MAFFAVSPARYRAIGRMGLQPTPGGFGTPQFEGQVARVEGTHLVFESAAGVATQEISTVRDAAVFFGGDYDVDWFTDFKDPLQPVDPYSPLVISEPAALFVADWFVFGWEVLEKLRSHAVGTCDPLVPNQMRYRTAPLPEQGDILISKTHLSVSRRKY